MNSLRHPMAVSLVIAVTLVSPVFSGAVSKTDTVNADTLPSTRLTVLDHDELNSLPVRSIEEVLGLQNGTVLLRGRQSFDISLTAPQVSARGSEPFETGFVLNGVNLNNPWYGYPAVTISPHALQSLSFEPAVLGVGPGFGGSGRVNMQTRSGGPKWSALVESISDNTLGTGFDQNWYTASIGGPVPGLRKTYIFGLVERRYFGDRSPSAGTDAFLPDSPIGLPGNWLQGWSYHGRLDCNFTDDLKLTATADATIDEWSRYIHSYYFNWPHLPYYKDQNLSLAARLDYDLTPTFRMSTRVSLFKAERFAGDGIHRNDIGAYVRPYANPWLDPYMLFYSWDDEDSVTADYDESHYWSDYERQKSSRLGIGVEFIKEWRQAHTFKCGFEYERYTLRAYHNMNPTTILGYIPRNTFHLGYDILGNEVDDGGTEWGNEAKHPMNLGFYLEDRIQLGGLTLTPGLRFELFGSDALRLKSKERPFDPDATGDTDLDLDDMEPVPTRGRWSPRISLMYITPFGMTLHGGAAIQYTQPGYSKILSDWRFFEARASAGSYYPFVSGDTGPLKSTSYEAGIGYVFGGRVSIDITGFHRRTNQGLTIYHQTPAVPFVYDIYASRDVARATGGELTIGAQLSSAIRYRLNYTYTSATSTGSYAQSAYNIAWKNPAGVPFRTFPVDYDGRHEVASSVQVITPEASGPRVAGAYPLERLKLTMISQTSSGLPYTPTNVYDAISSRSISQEPTGPINSARMPWINYVDMKLERTFLSGDFQITPFLWVRNLWDRTNILYVYSGTGQPDETGYLNTPEAQGRIVSDEQYPMTTGLGFEDRYKLLERNPLNFANPRQVLFGLRITF